MKPFQSEEASNFSLKERERKTERGIMKREKWALSSGVNDLPREKNMAFAILSK